MINENTVEPISDENLSVLESKVAERQGRWKVFTSEVECVGGKVCKRNSSDESIKDNMSTCEECIQIEGASFSPNIFTVDCGEYYGISNESAKYIAELHNEIPAILARLRKAESELSRYKDAVHWYADWTHWMVNPNSVIGDIEPAAHKDMGHIARVAVGMTRVDEQWAETAVRNAIKGSKLDQNHGT